MTSPAGARLARLAAGALALLASGSVVAACGASAGDLARASCAHVNTSLALLQKAKGTTDSQAATRLEAMAYIQLLQAIPIAAQAAYHDIQWESLATTLSEANRVPEATLIPALQAQCHNADSSVFGQVPPPAPAGNSG
ncbi:MAG: hypothetical protein ABSF84_11720 [Acidimicrobiales bacterium]